MHSSDLVDGLDAVSAGVVRLCRVDDELRYVAHVAHLVLGALAYLTRVAVPVDLGGRAAGGDHALQFGLLRADHGQIVEGLNDLWFSSD